MYNLAQWLQQHPQFGQMDQAQAPVMGQQGIPEGGQQPVPVGQPGMTPQGFFGNLAGLMNGGPMPGLAAWKARRIAAGLPWHGNQHQMGLPPQAAPQAQAASPLDSNYGGGAGGGGFGQNFGDRQGLPRSY